MDTQKILRFIRKQIENAPPAPYRSCFEGPGFRSQTEDGEIEIMFDADVLPRQDVMSIAAEFRDVTEEKSYVNRDSIVRFSIKREVTK